jgi:hypothetical protein
MDFETRNFVQNPNDPDLRETYEIVNELIDKAGSITIRDLFTRSPRQIGRDAWRAIQRAKGIGFLRMKNHVCCENDRCQGDPDLWCNSTPDGGCSAASDSCSLRRVGNP